LIGPSSGFPAPHQEQPHIEVPFANEEEESGGGFTLMQIWLMLRAHMWLSIGCMVLLLAIAYVVIKRMPKSYEAQATLIVNSDNTDTLAGRNYPIGQSGSFLPTQIELIYNSVMLLPVIDRLQLQKDRNFNSGYVGDQKTLNDIVLESLRASLSVKPGQGSQLLYITASARDPVRAADVANAVAEEYLKQSRQRINAPAIENEKRYNAQLQELKEKVDIAQAKVTEFREKNGMVDLKDGQAGDSEGDGLQDLQTKLREAQNTRRQLEARLGATGVEGASADGGEVVALRGRLAALENQLAASSTAMGPQHPTIKSLQAEIEATRSALQSGAATALTRARELEAKYQAAAIDEQSRLLSRRIVSDEGQNLLSELKTASDNYSAARRGLDQVQFASAGDYKDVTLVSRAEPPIRATKPNKMKMFLAAFVLSFGLAVGGPFAYELLLDRRIRSRDDLERGFRIVTLAQFGSVAKARPA
jgi:succinoglycan biosynthesis transport protein ExoP